MILQGEHDPCWNLSILSFLFLLNWLIWMWFDVLFDEVVETIIYVGSLVPFQIQNSLITKNNDIQKPETKNILLLYL